MTTQFTLYNDALGHIGERQLATLTENVESRRVLDLVWPGARKYCLEHGNWKFAQRTTELSYTPSVTPAFGYNRAFAKPTDMVRLSRMCSDEFFRMPMTDTVEENGFWFANIDTIYISYVSNDTAYGYDYSLWPETFSLFVSLYLALRIAPRIRSNMDLRPLQIQYERAKEDAQAKDAVQGPTQFLPQGSWASSRMGGYRGFRNTFYGG